MPAASVHTGVPMQDASLAQKLGEPKIGGKAQKTRFKQRLRKQTYKLIPGVSTSVDLSLCSFKHPLSPAVAARNNASYAKVFVV